MNTLNTEQQKAVDHIDGPFLCIAGPGSGKTFTLVQRVRNLVKHGINPASILVVTFTRNAAEEMRNRYLALPDAVDGPVFCTIHAFAYTVLCHEKGYTSENIMDQAAQTKFVKQILKDENIDRTSKDIQRMAKNMAADFSLYHCCSNKDDFQPSCTNSLDAFLPYYNAYCKYKEKYHLIDFDDMLFLCRDLFRDHPDVLNHYRERFQYLMVDEFQDTSDVQADILYRLAAPKNNIFIAGDDDQSIYAFRNAKPELMLDFPNVFKGCGIAHLTVNYRSEKAVVSAAGKLIQNNQERFAKDIHGNKNEAGAVTCFKCSSAKEEPDFVADLVIKENKANVPFEEMAVLCRTNSEVTRIAKKFSDRDIPFYSRDFLDDIHDTWLFKCLITYLKIAYKKHTNADILKVINKPSRYINTEYAKQSKGDLDVLYDLVPKPFQKRKIKQMVRDIKSVQHAVKYCNTISEVLDTIIDTFHIEDYIQDYCDYAILDEDKYMEYLNDYLNEAQDFKSYDDYMDFIEENDKKFNEKKNATKPTGVIISTIHGSKGLEWDEVIIPSCEHGNLPYIRKDEDDTPDIPREEERRLFYVALTRARNKCFMISVQGEKDSEYLKEAGVSL
jgi:DNA helicase-2/ATP-dependent DNA helicase PcrA